MEGAIGDGAVEGYNADFTWTAFFCCLTAASGGALFGYDNGRCFVSAYVVIIGPSGSAGALKATFLGSASAC